MSTNLAQVEQQARMLSEEDRARLADSMLASLQGVGLGEIAASWDQEIRDRVAAHERGEAPVVPAGDVFAEARRLTK
jgi:hypothetical protein